jgi:hypothetical protein
MPRKYLLNITKNTTKFYIEESNAATFGTNSNPRRKYDDFRMKEFHLSQFSMSDKLKEILSDKINRSMIIKIKHYNSNQILGTDDKYCIFIDDYLNQYFYNNNKFSNSQENEDIKFININDKINIEFDIDFYIHNTNIMDIIQENKTINDDETIMTIEFYFGN